MAKHGAILFSYIIPTLILLSTFLCKAIDEDRKVHIVYLGSLPDNVVYSPLSHHLSLLEKVVESNSPATFLTRSYKRSFSGFAAKLTDRERERLATMKEVVSVFPSRMLHPQTTRSWDFIGLNEKAKRSAGNESDTIIGVIDSGIWPESESFKDDGFGPPPKKWKGVCAGGKNFTCNKKLIGARFYNPEVSARDERGHGTHTASTAAGNVVEDVSFYGLANGTARGGVPTARIAAYKVCGVLGCPTEAILAAFDDAIADGVDIITVSLGSPDVVSLQNDPIAIGSFHAMTKGILTSNSAGNSGPSDATVSSVAPWMLTAAASSTDRRISDKIILGNGKAIVGASVNTFNLNGTSFPLIYGKEASSQGCSESDAGNCLAGCLDSGLVKGKVVLCDLDIGINVAYRAGAVGSVVRADWGDDSQIVPFPATTLKDKEYHVIKSYYKNSTRGARVNILRSEVERDAAAPLVASFSSRGPNPILAEIIKPDISAPGVSILAAFSPIADITENSEDTRHVNYSILSGTSMSCPHVAGAAAYVKTFHPDWSPAAIKSSLMTTASPMNVTYNSSKAAGEYAYGSGHINPVKAIDPGLVYEASEQDYIQLLCLILDKDIVRLISGDNSTCTTEKGSLLDHNYPSLAADVTANKSFSVTFHRRVKNVGTANSTYTATILGNSTQVDIKVEPQVLSFKSLNEEKTFVVTAVGKGMSEQQSHVSASLVWSDGIHSVRSPIVIHKKL